MNRIIDLIEKEQQKSGADSFKVGDSVRVHTRVVEGDKERIQIFTGIVIGRKGRGLNETFTVRRISYGEGVERVFPLHSPRVARVEVEQQGRARRAKLNYLRTRKGKEATAVREWTALVGTALPCGPLGAHGVTRPTDIFSYAQHISLVTRGNLL